MILVTGAAGFSGFHLAMAFLSQWEAVFGKDNLNEYYDLRLKVERLKARGTERLWPTPPYKSYNVGNTNPVSLWIL